jgi:hypothetical protein
MFELQRLGREKEFLLEEKRQLRDEKLLLLMLKMPAAVGSAAVSRMVSHAAHHAHGASAASAPLKRLRDGPPHSAPAGVFSWHLVSPMMNRRMGPAAAAVRIGSDTHVVVSGGYNGDVDENVQDMPPRHSFPALFHTTAQVATCEALLSNGQASPLHVSDMLVARAWHCAVACGGFLYVMGGADNAQRYLCSVERCSLHDGVGRTPTQPSGVWQPRAPMTCTRYGFAAVSLNGLIYCIGGYDGETWLDTVERYFPDRCTARHPSCRL